tara:strand:+ start:245 stop:499 length:255 start_codon:yes stop_codon:yes gene_type:complete
MKKNRISTTKLLDILESQLKSHDWFYEYSDDSRYYNSGLREFTQIWQTVEQLQAIGENEFDLAIAMYKKHKPVVTTPNEVRITN